MPYNLLMPEKEDHRSPQPWWLLVWQRRWWIALATLFILVWWLVPPLLYRHTGTPKADKLEAITDTRTALLAGLIGVGALLTFWLNSRVYRITAQGHITERYTKAIDQLDDEKALAVRLGGLYALERIARDSPPDRATIAEVLCTYARSAPPSRPPARPAMDTGPPITTAAEAVTPTANPASLTVRAPDVQAALTILGRWRNRLGKPPPVLDLHNADLQGAILVGAELQGAILVGAQLQGANLFGARLQGANLDDADLQGAILVGAQLQGANLAGAQLQGARLNDADLQDANLSGAQLQDVRLNGARLQKAMLISARLQKAILFGAQLQDAILVRARLQGARLDGAQLQGAALDGAELQGARASEATCWPEGWDHARARAAGVGWDRAFFTADEVQLLDLSGSSVSGKVDVGLPDEPAPPGEDQP
jgi:uncharacterized protein YjbI with pentapeptide repeats/uncharacterized membrane protein (DUF485 family)